MGVNECECESWRVWRGDVNLYLWRLCEANLSCSPFCGWENSVSECEWLTSYQFHEASVRNLLPALLGCCARDDLSVFSLYCIYPSVYLAAIWLDLVLCFWEAGKWFTIWILYFGAVFSLTIVFTILWNVTYLQKRESYKKEIRKKLRCWMHV